MCAELVIIVSNSTSSASLWSSMTDGRSVAQKPVLLQRLRNRSRRSRSAAEQLPVQAGAQYMIFATIVARNTSCNDVDGMPWLRRTRRAYSRLQQDDSNWSTWSVAVSRLLRMTPSTLWLLTRSMLGHGGDIKVTNSSLTQNKCLQCVTLPLAHVEILWPCDVTELNNDRMIKLGDICTLPNSTKFIKFYERDLINSDFLLEYSFSSWLSCFFYICKAFVKCLFLSGIFDDVIYYINST